MTQSPMRRPTRTLAAFLFLTACGPAPPPPVASAPAALTPRGVDAPFVLDMADQLTDADNRTKNLKKGFERLTSYERCHALGEPLCGQQLVYGGLCDVFEQALNALLPAVDALGLPAAQTCLNAALGTGAGLDLKCCIYPGNTDCHSAFNTRRPINCEGNPFAGLTQGTCVPVPGGSGCLCGHLPACSGGATPAGLDDPLLLAFRLETLGRKMMGALPGVAKVFTDSFIDYVSFRGYREHATAVRTLAPFVGPEHGLPAAEVYHGNDGDVRAATARAGASVAIARVFAGVPNIARRWSAISTVPLTPAARAAYLSGITNPDQVLRDAVGSFGLTLLKAAEPELYALLAVPLTGEAPATPGVQGGAHPGQAATITLTTSVVSGGLLGDEVVARLGVVDPLATDNPDGSYPAAVDWGDDRIDGLAYRTGRPSTFVRKHRYAIPGQYRVRALLTNTSGLLSIAEQVVIVTGMARSAGPATASVALDLKATVRAGQHGSLYVDVEGVDTGGGVHPLGLYFVTLSGGTAETVTAQLPAVALENIDLSRLSRLRLRPRHVDAISVFSAELSLGPVSVTRYASPGRAPTTVTAQPTAATVQAGGPATPAPAEPATGRLLLPTHSAVIDVAL